MKKNICIKNKDFEVVVYKSNWKDTTKIGIYNKEYKLKYTLNPSKTKLFALDGWKWLHVIDLTTGKIIHSLVTKRQSKANIRLNEILYTHNHIIHYNGNYVSVYQENLELAYQLSDSLLNYAKLNYNINNCQGNLGNFIDSIFIKKENVFIIHSYCEGQKDTLKVGSFW